MQNKNNLLQTIIIINIQFTIQTCQIFQQQITNFQLKPYSSLAFSYMNHNPTPVLRPIPITNLFAANIVPQLPKVKSQQSSYCIKLFSQATSDCEKLKNNINNICIPTTLIIEPQHKNQQNQQKQQNAPLSMMSINNHSSKNSIKIKKQKKKNPFDYRKNICGYITKKIIREFTNSQYKQKINEICRTHDCDYNKAKLYYSNKIQHVTGPSHIPGLLIPEGKNQIKIKRSFREFFQWFLREQYLRYILIQGKMADKKAYIQYKNNILLNMVNPCNILYPVKIQPDCYRFQEQQKQIKRQMQRKMETYMQKQMSNQMQNQSDKQKEHICKIQPQTLKLIDENIDKNSNKIKNKSYKDKDFNKNTNNQEDTNKNYGNFMVHIPIAKRQSIVIVKQQPKLEIDEQIMK